MYLNLKRGTLINSNKFNYVVSLLFNVGRVAEIKREIHKGTARLSGDSEYTYTEIAETDTTLNYANIVDWTHHRIQIYQSLHLVGCVIPPW